MRYSRMVSNRAGVRRRMDRSFLIHGETMKITIDQNLHTRMKELSRRRKRETGLTIGGFYAEAFSKFLERNKVPKKVEVINRRQFRFDMPIGVEDALKDLQVLAWRDRVSLNVMLERAVTDYLDRPENYLGDNFNKTIKKEFRSDKHNGK